MVTATAQQFPCSGPVAASVRVGGGIVSVTADENATAAVVDVAPYDDTEPSRAAAANTRVDFADGQLRVQAPENVGGWLRRGGRIRLHLRLPRDSQVRVQSGSADIRLEGMLASASVQTGSGDAVVDRMAGDLSVQTGSGDLRAAEIGGDLRARSGSGDVTAQHVFGGATVHTASGDVTIGAVDGTMQAVSASGDIRVRSIRGGQLMVKTASGDVSVGVPAGTRVWLDLATTSGSTRSDLAMASASTGEGAQLNLTVRTTSGDIDVHRVLSVAA